MVWKWVVVDYFNPSHGFVKKISAQVNYVKLFAKLTVISSRSNWNIMGGLEFFAKEAEWFCQLYVCQWNCWQFRDPRLHMLKQQMKPYKRGCISVNRLWMPGASLCFTCEVFFLVNLCTTTNNQHCALCLALSGVQVHGASGWSSPGSWEFSCYFLMPSVDTCEEEVILKRGTVEGWRK